MLRSFGVEWVMSPASVVLNSIDIYHCYLFQVMGSFRGKCEIVVVKEEQGTTPRPQTFRHVKAQDKEQKPPIMKKGYNNSLEDDINKLFEAVNLRASKSLDLSDLRRNTSKKPMRVSGSHSPGIGFSEPVSLKQALRGLCISQAAEVAAMKRLSMPSASPRISEAGRITNLYKSVVVEAGESGCSLTEGAKPGIKISLGPKESTSSSSDTVPQLPEDAMVKLATQSSCSSPSFDVKPIMKYIDCVSSDSVWPLGENGGCNVGLSVVEEETASCSSVKLPQHVEESKKKPLNQSDHSSPHFPVAFAINDAESSLVHDDTALASNADTQLLETTCSVEEHSTVFVLPHCNASGNLSKTDKKNFGSNKVASGISTNSATSLEVISKTAPKLKRKSKLKTVPSSNAIKNNREVKSTRSSSRAVKPVIRNKNLVIKKSKKVVGSTYGNSKKSNEVSSSQDHSSGQMICQKCQCFLKDSSNDPLETTGTEVFMDSKNCDGSKPGSIQTSWENRGTPVVKTNIASKFGKKGDISQSSKSSICDFSSSTTSLSDESNLSGSTCGNRPHMSKDMRWEAICRIRKHGFLGLNHFNLLKKLGSGDIGTVYLSELIGTNCLFAIKVMDNEFLARRKKMPRAYTEREILGMLDHPFLPTLYAQFTSDNLSCLVMEFCPGGDLHVLRQKQPGRYFTEQAARFYVAEVLLALEYLHMLGIVYRDLKPENILVRKDGHIMLTDFDLSLRCSVNPTLIKSSTIIMEPPRVSGPCAGSNCIDPFCNGPSCKVSCFNPRLLPSTARARKQKIDAEAQARSLPQLVAEPTEARSNSFVGTHEYLAPEIIKGEGHGSAVDWWTFGIFLYELLYGKTPFKGAGNDETLANVVLQNLKFPDTPIVSFQARDLIRGLLVKEPGNRLGTETGAAEIKRHLFFEGLNWALIRCAIPPQIPDLHDTRNSQIAASQGKEKRHMNYSADGEHLEFELF